MTAKEEVLFESGHGAGWIILNRSEALHALSFTMVHLIRKQLRAWEKNDDIALVCLISQGEKAFCAGGDVRSLHDRRGNGLEEFAKNYFAAEYEMDLLIHEFPKPVLVYMNGIVMGGGAGISAGATFRIVTERTKWAMPETNIGFFPDVGANYFLNKMPGEIGTYLALTSKTIQAEDLLYAGAADFYLESSKWAELELWIRNRHWKMSSAMAELQEKLELLSSPFHSPKLELDKINYHFKGSTVEEIIRSLSEEAEEGNWEWRTKQDLLLKSPSAMKITLEHLRRSKSKSVKDCLKLDYDLALRFMQSSHDFFEGVRAVLVDKDRKPNWKPASINEVSKEFVEEYFRPYKESTSDTAESADK